jgi:hypothetical protein
MLVTITLLRKSFSCRRLRCCRPFLIALLQPRIRNQQTTPAFTLYFNSSPSHNSFRGIYFCCCSVYPFRISKNRFTAAYGYPERNGFQKNIRCAILSIILSREIHSQIYEVCHTHTQYRHRLLLIPALGVLPILMNFRMS